MSDPLNNDLNGVSAWQLFFNWVCCVFIKDAKEYVLEVAPLHL